MEEENTPQTPETPAETPAPEEPAEKSAEECKCIEVSKEEWDKKHTTIEKSFYKTWSPRLFYYPFSMGIDIQRAIKGAKEKGYTVPEKMMLIDTGGMFWASIMVEVDGAKTDDPNVVSLAGKKVYTHVSTRPWKEMKTDVEELNEELGYKPDELYFWYTSCPKCTEEREVKSVLIAVEQEAVAAEEAAPAEEAEPEKDAAPEKESAPAEESAPEKESAPETPETPAEEPAKEEPVAAEPETPTEPETPAEPETPSEPETPAETPVETPAEPEPETPAEPAETPTEPEAPAEEPKTTENPPTSTPPATPPTP